MNLTNGRAGEDGARDKLRQSMGFPERSVSSSGANATTQRGGRPHAPAVRSVYGL